MNTSVDGSIDTCVGDGDDDALGVMQGGRRVASRQRIPKRIHYCWLSSDEMPPLNRKCVESWRKHMPDYELVCWDFERSRHLMNVEFVREACSARAWAFAADYIRLHALLHEGGIYLDSDVQVFRPFDAFLHHSAFSAIEHWPSINGLGIEGAVVGAEKHHPWISQCLDSYENLRFSDGEGAREQFIVSGVLARVAASGFGFSYKAESQTLASGIHIYPPVVFTHLGGQYSETETYALHHCSGSWRQLTFLERLRANVRGIFSRDSF